MITVFYGDDFYQSRMAYHQARQDLTKQQIVFKSFNEANLNTESLTQCLEAKSLFKENQAVAIENLFNAPEFPALIDIIKKNADKTILIWQKNNLNFGLIRELQLLKSIRLQSFKVQPIVFTFLDGLRPHSARISLNLFYQALKIQPVELIFYLLGRRISQLISRRGGYFNLQQLLNLHQQLLTAEFNLKSGRSDLSLTLQLDLILAKL